MCRLQIYLTAKNQDLQFSVQAQGSTPFETWNFSLSKVFVTGINIITQVFINRIKIFCSINFHHITGLFVPFDDGDAYFFMLFQAMNYFLGTGIKSFRTIGFPS